MSSIDQFVHLHVHTQYSLLDGANKIDPLMRKAKEYQMPAIAMTDHGNLFGAIEFYQAAKKHGVKPIIGCEVYITPRSRFERQDLYFAGEGAHQGKKINNASFHLILLAQDAVGYQNLLRIVSLSHLEGFYYRPRIDFDLLSRYRQGIIALSGCLKGQIAYMLTRGDEDRAYATAGLFKDLFGAENYFLEIQGNGLEDQRIANREIIGLSKKMGIPLVATNDCHYLEREDAVPHDILLCLQTGKTLEDPARLKFGSHEFYLKSPQEMVRSFEELPEAILNTLEIADRVNLDLDLNAVHMPPYKMEGEGLGATTVPELFVRASHEGLLARFEELSLGEEDRALYLERLEREIRVIQKMGYEGYFLIVWDFIKKAREMGIPVGPGRGSAAGSLVAYSLRITNIEPIRFGLLFERFLNPERVSLPDIDVDFCMNRRGEVIQYVVQKYGMDRVAMIATFGTMGAKGSIRDVGRVLGMSYAEVDKVAKMIPNSLEMTLEKALKETPELQALLDRDPRIEELFSLSRKLEGITRHSSIHAAGVVISQNPLTEYVPLMKGANGEIVTQFTKDDVEKVGLVKFDFLGLTTLTLIQGAEQRIWKHTPEFSIDRIPLDDPKTYKLLSEGRSLGIFQLESRGMTDLIVKMQPETFEDLIALLALYRPGPINSGMVDDFIKRKKNPREIQYEFPELEPVLRETYGVIVYQEQVMQIANVLAGFSLGEADLLRRAMGKKKPEEMDKMRNKFVEGSIRKGFPKDKSEHVFDLMAYFAGYGFNKSHSAAYALISYQTAYLKAHYPVELWAALLTNALDDTEKIGVFLVGAKEMGISVLPPDINQSELDFLIFPEAQILFGLGAVKNVGKQAVDVILENRASEGVFKDFPDFLRRISGKRVNRRVIEALIRAGAFRSLEIRRSVAMESLDDLLVWAEKQKSGKPSPQKSLFKEYAEPDATHPPVKDVPEWDERTLLQEERNALGFYLTSHPMAQYGDLIGKLDCKTTRSLEFVSDGEMVRVFGVIGSVREVKTRKGDKMAQFTLLDIEGSIESVLFPDMYAKSQSLLVPDIPLLVTGTLERNDFGSKIRAVRVESLDQAMETFYQTVAVHLQSEGLTKADLFDLKSILKQYPGPVPAILELKIMSRPYPVAVISLHLNVSPSDTFVRAVESRFGEGAVSRREDMDPDLRNYLVGLKKKNGAPSEGGRPEQKRADEKMTGEKRPDSRSWKEEFPVI